MDAEADLRVLVLGPTGIRRAEQDRELRGAAPRRLLTVLCAGRGEPLSDERLAEVLWGGAPPMGPAATLQSHVSRLRSALGDTDRRLLRRTSDGYLLRLPPDTLDVDIALRLVGAAEQERDPRAALAHVTAALALWRGMPYVDAGDAESSGVGPERARLQELREHAVEVRLSLLLDTGDAAGALPDLVRLTAEAPFRERGWELLVLALYRTGRQADALAALRRVRELLDEELGIAPGEALQRLEMAVLGQDPALLLENPTPVRANVTPLGRGGVRKPITRFLGRTADLEFLSEAVQRVPVVTVTGPAGVGKTRLVVELLSDWQAPDGPWMVRLADAVDENTVALQVASALGLALTEGAASVPAALAGRNGLLVLDNCEHVLADAGALVAELLDCAPGITVLATSREPLGIDGELVHALAPLGDDAVALLLDRVTAVRPGWQPEATDHAAMQRIAGALDGLPLALELVAARARLLSLTELADHLDDSLMYTVRLNRGGVSPHATLGAAIDWSLNLLSGPERELLLRLWPFEGGLTLDAAEAVTGPDPETLPRLAGLVGRSLVAADPSRTPTRFRLLETIRTRCRQLDPDPATSRNRHAVWIRGLVASVERDMPGPHAGPLFRRLDQELPNLRAAVAHDLVADPVAALRTVTGLGWWLYRRGHVAQGLSWLEAALEDGCTAPPALRARAHCTLGALRSLAGDLASGLESYATAASLLLASPDHTPEIDAAWVEVRHFTALGQLFSGQFLAAERTALANLEPARDVALGVYVSSAQLVLGAAAVSQGRLTDGTEHLQAAVATADEIGHAWTAAFAERLLAGFTLAAGSPAQALTLLVRAGHRSATEDDVSSVLAALVLAASALAALGRTRDAAAVASAAIVRAAQVSLRLDGLAMDATPQTLPALAEAGTPHDRHRGEQAGRTATLAELVDLCEHS